MVRTGRFAGLVVALCLVTAAPAHAAFAPDLTLGLEPPTASSLPSLTATLEQPALDTPVERFTLHLPAGFEPAGAPAAATCSVGDLFAGSCPRASAIGVVEARIGNSAPFSGAMYKLSADRFAASVSTLGGAIAQVVPGSLTKRADGSLDLKLDRLPALPLTRISFRFAGGGLSFVRAPSACGDHNIDGKFTSRAGDLALERTRVAVTGCSGVPAVRVANIRLNHRQFKSGGGYRTIIAWWASQPVDHTNVRIERRVRGRWRTLGVLVGDGVAGDNTLRWDGMLRNRALRPGAYGIRIQPAGSAPSGIVRFRIR